MAGAEDVNTGSSCQQLCLVTEAACVAHPEKVALGGEDAYFISVKGAGAFGVADGVGGWRNRGVNPADYSQTFMHNVKMFLEERDERLVEGPFQPPMKDCGRPLKRLQQMAGRNPLGAMMIAHAVTRVMGSTTACVLKLNAAEGRLEAANLGDSGFAVLRGGKVAVQSRILQHNFDCPLQFGHPSLVKCTDWAANADTYTIGVQPGDVIIAGTDGLWDNVFVEDVASIVRQAGVNIKQAASKILALAYENSLDPTFQSPYYIKAKQQWQRLPWWDRVVGACMGGGSHHPDRILGGKPDDITVVISLVCERIGPAPASSPARSPARRTAAPPRQVMTADPADSLPVCMGDVRPDGDAAAHSNEAAGGVVEGVVDRDGNGDWSSSDAVTVVPKREQDSGLVQQQGLSADSGTAVLPPVVAAVPAAGVAAVLASGGTSDGSVTDRSSGSTSGGSRASTATDDIVAGCDATSATPRHQPASHASAAAGEGAAKLHNHAERANTGITASSTASSQQQQVPSKATAPASSQQQQVPNKATATATASGKQVSGVVDGLVRARSLSGRSRPQPASSDRPKSLLCAGPAAVLQRLRSLDAAPGRGSCRKQQGCAADADADGQDSSRHAHQAGVHPAHHLLQQAAAMPLDMSKQDALGPPSSLLPAQGPAMAGQVPHAVLEQHLQPPGAAAQAPVLPVSITATHAVKAGMGAEQAQVQPGDAGLAKAASAGHSTVADASMVDMTMADASMVVSPLPAQSHPVPVLGAHPMAAHISVAASPGTDAQQKPLIGAFYPQPGADTAAAGAEEAALPRKARKNHAARAGRSGARSAHALAGFRMEACYPGRRHKSCSLEGIKLPDLSY